MSIKILNSGLLTTVQDLGRIGYQEAGFSFSGALDRRSLQIANILVNNPDYEAAIEMTLFGATMEFQTANVIAITGCHLGPLINDKEVPMYAAQSVKAGDVLTFGFAKYGCRAYVAFSGGIAIPEVLGSKSTNLKCGIGGYLGRALKPGDEIPFSHPVASLPAMLHRRIPEPPPIDSKEEVTIRVILGPQADYFTPKGIETFLNATYQITDESDRMGCKLSGPAIEYTSGVDIISDGIAFGGVQISPNGKPIVMLSDRQTTGGYAKIATLISVDLPAFVQRKPGDKIRFQEISIEKAQKLYKKEKRGMEKLKTKILKLKS